MKEAIVNTAVSLGWDAIASYRHMKDHNDAEWYADVLITKGKVKIAIVIQSTPLTKADFQNRTDRISDAGVRVAWLYQVKKPLRGNADRPTAKPSNNDMPVFGYLYDKEADSYTVTQFSIDLTIEKFVIGMLTKKIKWFPKTNELVDSMLIPYTENCPACKSATVAIYGLRLNAVTPLKIESEYKLANHSSSEQRRRAAFFHFYKKEDQELSCKVGQFIDEHLQEYQESTPLGLLKVIDGEYFCTCMHCGEVLPHLNAGYIKGSRDSAKSDAQEHWFDSTTCCSAYGESYQFRLTLSNIDLGVDIWNEGWFYG